MNQVCTCELISNFYKPHIALAFQEPALRFI